MSATTIDIFAGNTATGALKFVESELKKSFCTSEEEFKEEWPNDDFKRYRITITAEPVDEK